MKTKIWLSSPHMGDKEHKYVNEAFATNWIAPLGPHVDGFEKDLCSYTGAAHAAALSSGTSAIHLALVQLGVGLGDYVICQSFTFSGSANPIAYQGAVPVFVDSEPETWNMDPEQLEKAIIACIEGGKDSRGNGLRKAKPKAIIPVHLYGTPAKMEAIVEISQKYGIPLVEDAAEALGSTLNSKACGTFGDFGVLSFNGNKIITTSGGGALLANSAEVIAKTRFLATQARDTAPHYQHSQIGYNYRMSNVCAAIGRGQMEVLNDRVKQRRANFAYYFKELGSVKGFYFPSEPDGAFCNRWLSCVLIEPKEAGVDREKIRLALEKENIECRPLWKPMHLQPVFADAPFFGDGTSKKLFEDGLCLPSGSNLSEGDLDRVVVNIKKLL